MSYRSLEDALLFGTGVEREFICPAHDDHDASASVNAVTGLFFCYACGYRGKIDGSKVEWTPEGVRRYIYRLTLILEPEKRYSESWLNSFDSTGPGEYWLSRFDQETCRHYRLGHADGVATYPMRDNGGNVMGVVSRDLTEKRDQKYLYPPRVRNSQYLIDYHRVESPSVILVEGMADVCAVHQAGYDVALGCYRAWLSDAQAALLRRYQPDQVLVGYDMDKAGEAGYQRAQEVLRGLCPVRRMWWDDFKDLADIPLAERREMLSAVL
jgi:DNA primase